MKIGTLLMNDDNNYQKHRVYLIITVLKTQQIDNLTFQKKI